MHYVVHFALAVPTTGSTVMVMMKAARISKDSIAKACGVNLTTVTLALNHHPRVAEKTRVRIAETARRLGYEPNQAARNLVRRRYGRYTRLVERVGLVLYSEADEMLKTVYLAFLLGMEKRVAELGGTLVFLRETPGAADSRLLGLARAGTVDGLVLVGDVNNAAVHHARATKVPFVVLGDHHGTLPVHQTTGDFRASGRQAVRYLAELGHRHIGLVGGALGFVYQQETHQGALEAVTAYGLSSRTAYMHEGERCTPLPELLNAMLGATPTPTALVVVEPGLATAVMAELARRGTTVPEQLSVVFCAQSDAVPIVPDSAHVDLSMAAVAAASMGQLQQLAAEPDLPAKPCLLAPRLLEGWSARRLVS